MFFYYLLPPTSHTHPESAAPGSGRGDIEGGAPLRYELTTPSWHALSPWNDSSQTYGQLQLNIGSNSNARLEVVSSLNFPMQANAMYYFDYAISVQKYNPKLYLGTLHTVAPRWLYDRQIYAGSIIDMPETWPQNSPQKGEANSEGYSFKSKGLHTSCNNIGKYAIIRA